MDNPRWSSIRTHRELRDAVRETEDLRILAVALAVGGKTDIAQQMLSEVIERAVKHERPLLVANAQRDLAHTLAREGQVEAAKGVARAAREAFERLGASREVEKLEMLLHEPDFLND